MSLFKALLRLHPGPVPLEDFFTEVIAQLFRSAPATLFAWLDSLDIVDTRAVLDASVSTQVEFAPMAHHSVSSRPDLLIELSDGRYADMVMVESKVGSTEGIDQLARYAEILAQLPALRRRVLIYITREHDPKDAGEILARAGAARVRFVQLRWHSVYRLLRTQPAHALIDETLRFMEEHGMAQSNQFTAVDILALANYHKVLTMMDETMWGAVAARFEALVGGVNARRSSSFSELQRNGRYIMHTELAPKSWWCGLGYHLRLAAPTDYPTVRLMIEVQPTSPHRQAIIQAFQEISQRPGWHGSALSQPRTWSAVLYERSMRDFLAEDDHVRAIERFFLEALDELDVVRRTYAHLPWRGAGQRLAAPGEDTSEG